MTREFADRVHEFVRMMERLDSLHSCRACIALEGWGVLERVEESTKLDL